MAVMQKQNSPRSNTLSAYVPVRMIEVEIGQTLPTLYAFDEKRKQQYQRARCLVRLHTQPLGLVELQFTENELQPTVYAPQIWRQLQTAINSHLISDGFPAVTTLTEHGLPAPAPRCIEKREQFLATAPFVSIIVPTHDRPEQLETCLKSLLTLHYPHFEIIVVDNAPGNDSTLTLVKQLAQHASYIRYVREDRQGPSWARNCGIQAAKAEILAFTDDDVVVDRYWLARLMQGFADDKCIACVTGLVLPLELETPAQFLFEAVGGYSKGYQRRVFAFKEDQSQLPLHPYVAERFGTGASMVLRAAVLRSIGGFDPALGRVGPVRCSQDIAVFFQVIANGHKLAYEPASLAYHTHRREYAGLRKQTYNHSVGYTAYLTKSLLENPRLLFDFTSKVPFALFTALKARKVKKNTLLRQYAEEIKELQTLRRKGLLYGPIAFARSRWQIRSFKGK